MKKITYCFIISCLILPGLADAQPYDLDPPRWFPLELGSYWHYEYQDVIFRWDVIKTADWVIDLGPEGGQGGGEIVAVGPPEKIAATKGSYTGRYLSQTLGRSV